MAYNADGTPGSRPGSRQEVEKLPRYTCEWCLFTAVGTMVILTEDGHRGCKNTNACAKRVWKQEKDK